MSGTQIQAKPIEHASGVMDAIFGRRSVRDYAPESLDQSTIEALLTAAVQAPTAMHEEPWAFVVVQNKEMLKRLSDTAKELLVRGTDASHPSSTRLAIDRFTHEEFNIFYNAGTLIIVCAKPSGPFIVSDCWLAAENLMLAAYANGLGSCVIGLAVSALNTPDWKRELDIPEEFTVFAPIIVGMPAGKTLPRVPRKPPYVLNWKR